MNSHNSLSDNPEKKIKHLFPALFLPFSFFLFLCLSIFCIDTFFFFFSSSMMFFGFHDYADVFFFFVSFLSLFLFANANTSSFCLFYVCRAQFGNVVCIYNSVRYTELRWLGLSLDDDTSFYVQCIRADIVISVTSSICCFSHFNPLVCVCVCVVVMFRRANWESPNKITTMFITLSDEHFAQQSQLAFWEYVFRYTYFLLANQSTAVYIDARAI